MRINLGNHSVTVVVLAGLAAATVITCAGIGGTAGVRIVEVIADKAAKRGQ